MLQGGRLRGGVGVEETVVGVGGGVVEGVPDFTSYCDCTGSGARQVAVAA
jgi:hypothetical protein